MWELACLRWFGSVNLMHRVVCIAGKPTPTRDCGFFSVLSDMPWNVTALFSVVVDVRLAIL
jgi:hypothetical protein